VDTDPARPGPHDEPMFTTEEIDTFPHDGPTDSLIRLASISFALATLITFAWIALGVLLVGF